jgi:chloride channel protein, CIC family
MTSGIEPEPRVSPRFGASLVDNVTAGWDSLGSLLGTALREERFFLILSVFIGIFSGLAVVCFRIAIEWSRVFLLGPQFGQSPLRLVLVPAGVGLVVGVLVIHVFPTVRGSGVNQTKAALYIFNGYISFRTAIGKFITSALAIGSGQSLGPEDPSLQIGAGLASMLGRRLKLSRDRLRLIAPVGAAAGLAAAFNAPISAVLFVIEEVIGRWSAGILGSVVLSAVSSVVVMRWFLGPQPLFRIPATQLLSPKELLAYAVLGIVGGFVAVLFSKSIGALRPRLHALPKWTQYFQSAVAGLIIGGMGALGATQVMGAGYESIDLAMHNQFTWKILALLVVLKIIATTLSFSSGSPGGMFAPALFVGAMLGGMVGDLEHLFFPSLTGSIATYSLVGMGVLFAAFLRAPMTSVFMVLEVSGNYSVIVPVIVANTFAYVISRALQPAAIFDVLTRQDGLDLPSMEEQREEDILRVEDAMKPPSAPVLDADEPLGFALKQVQESSAESFLVRLNPSGWGSITKKEIQTRVGEGKSELSVSSVLFSRQVPYLHPDQQLETALRYVYQFPVVPVVSRANLRELQGVITQRDVMARYAIFGPELAKPPKAQESTA